LLSGKFKPKASTRLIKRGSATEFKNGIVIVLEGIF